jgi:hypothetical protein
MHVLVSVDRIHQNFRGLWNGQGLVALGLHLSSGSIVLFNINNDCCDLFIISCCCSSPGNTPLIKSSIIPLLLCLSMSRGRVTRRVHVRGIFSQTVFADTLLPFLVYHITCFVGSRAQMALECVTKAGYM